MVHDWPAEHTYKNLKREVLLKLIEDREEVATKLQPHLDKQSLLYKQAVGAIHECMMTSKKSQRDWEISLLLP